MNKPDPRLHDDQAARRRLFELDEERGRPKPIPPEAWIISCVIAIAFVVAIIRLATVMSAA